MSKSSLHRLGVEILDQFQVATVNVQIGKLMILILIKRSISKWRTSVSVDSKLCVPTRLIFLRQMLAISSHTLQEGNPTLTVPSPNIRLRRHAKLVPCYQTFSALFSPLRSNKIRHFGIFYNDLRLRVERAFSHPLRFRDRKVSHENLTQSYE